MKSLIVLVVMVAVVAGGYSGWMHYHATDHRPQFRTAAVDRGDLKATITSTGTIQPVVTVDVGSQVSGTIQNLYVDFNSPVKEGQVIAQLDPSLYSAKVHEDQANLQKSIADVARVKADLFQAQRDWDRAQAVRIRGKGFITDAELDADKAKLDSSKAQVAVSEAAVNVARATLATSQTNLRYSKITAPVTGVVTARKVDVGQTVAASFTAPSLFLVAEDLSKVQVQAAVDEADIGKVFVGQKATFTADAYGPEEFQGTVSMVRLNPTSVQNVVTYTVIVDTANPPRPPRYPYGKLLPGLTANLSFLVEEKSDVLRVPNAALRFRPEPAQVAPDARARSAGASGAKSWGAQAGTGASAVMPKADSHHKMLWIVDGPYVRPVPVKVGISDNVMTEIVTNKLKEGDQVVIGVQANASASGESNPFAPTLFKKKSGR